MLFPLQIIDMGLLLHKGSYLRNGWNCMDCVIVVASLVSLSVRSNIIQNILKMLLYHLIEFQYTFGIIGNII